MGRLLLLVLCACMVAAAACSSSSGGGSKTPGPAGGTAAPTPDLNQPNVTDTVTVDPTRAPPRSQQAGLTTAATGTWDGDFGSLAFFGDGTAKFVVKTCGSSAVTAAGKPFHVVTDCDPTTVEGALTIGDHSFTVTDASRIGTTYQAYVDGAGMLHVSQGTLDEVDQNRAGVVTLFAKGTLFVGDSCRYKPPSAPASMPVKCTYDEEFGQQVLTSVLPPVDAGGPADQQQLVYVPESGLLVSPGLYVAQFHREP